MDFLHGPWPWYITGPLMGATIPLLLFWANKMLGASSSLKHICALIPNRLTYFQYPWKSQASWNLLFVLGVAIGAGITYHFLYNAEQVAIAASTQIDLLALGITDQNGLIPSQIFTGDQLWTIRGLSFTIFGGFLVGFGVRYAGGCTSGHGFMGLSQLSVSSTIAVVSFFAGGILFTHFLLPAFLNLNLS